MPGKQLQFSDDFHKTYDPSVRAAHALADILTQTDRILLGRRLSVIVGNSADEQTQPFSNVYRRGEHNVLSSIRSRGEYIVLPFMTHGVSKDPVVTTLGYNYHAIGHRFFSPKAPDYVETELSKLGFDLSSVNMKIDATKNTGEDHFGYIGHCASAVYHMFECARIERLMIAAYPSTRSYFAAATYNKVSTILDPDYGPKTLGRAGRIFGSYLYLALRPYLARPLRLRALADLKNLIPNITFDDNEVSDAVHKYLSMAIDGDLVFTAEHVGFASDVFYELMNVLFAANNIDKRAFDEPLPYGSFMSYLAQHNMLCTCADSANDGAKSSDQGQSQSVLQDVAKSQDQSDGDGSESDEGNSDGQSGESGSSEAGAGASDGSGEQSLEDALEEASSDARDEAHDTDASRGEVDRLRGAMAGRGTYSTPHTASKRKPSAEYVLMQKQMAREFGKVVEEADPGFVTHQPSGRVSMRRAMAGIEDYDTAFDSWDEGNSTATSMEIALLVDRSGSMSNLMREACESAWAIARGVESLGDNVKVTTIFFDDESILVKPSTDRENNLYRNVSSNGGTDPTTAFVDVLNLFKGSGRAHRVCIVLTDGQWYGSYHEEAHPDGHTIEISDADQLVKQIRNEGGYVGIATMLGPSAYAFGGISRDAMRHNANYETRIREPKDFVSFARGIVKEIMTNGWVAHHQDAYAVHPEGDQDGPLR